MTATVDELSTQLTDLLDRAMTDRVLGRIEEADEWLLEAGQLLQQNMIENAIEYRRGTDRAIDRVTVLSVPITGGHYRLMQPLINVPDVLSYGVLRAEWYRPRRQRATSLQMTSLQVTGLATDMVGLAEFIRALEENAISDLERWWLSVPSADMDVVTAYRRKSEHVAKTIQTWMTCLRDDRVIRELALDYQAKWGRIAERDTIQRYLDRYQV